MPIGSSWSPRLDLAQGEKQLGLFDRFQDGDLFLQ